MIMPLDFAAIEIGDDGACEALRRAHRRVGACYLDVSQVLPPAEFETFFEVVGAFFALPEERKKQVERAKSANYRGYVGVGEEFTNGSADVKESFEFAKPQPAAEGPGAPPYHAMYGDNQWLPEATAPGFRLQLERYLAAMERISRGVMRGLGQSLGLARAPAGDADDDPCLFARAICYAAAEGRARDTPLLEAHTDHALVAVVAESARGLEVQTAGGDWTVAVTRPGVVVVMLGELAEFWSRGYFRARPHRVRNGALDQTRLSLTSFYLPHLDSTLEPLDEGLVASLRERTPEEPQESSWRDRVRDPRFRRPSALDASDPVRVGEKEWQRLNDIFPDKAEQSSAPAGDGSLASADP